MSKRVVDYKMWKQSRHKWDSYIHNRHRTDKLCDEWDRYILQQIGKDNAIAYDCGGMFYKDFNPDITVVENYPCPVNVDGIQSIDNVDKKFNNMILINPITLKYNSSIVHFLTTEHRTRGGYKPNLIDWLTEGSKIFLSFSDWHIYFDRLKYSIDEMVERQIHDLEANSFSCLYKDVGNANEDYINGNVKLVLETK